MPPLAVVEDLDVLGDFPNCLFPGFVTPVMHEFILERAPEALHRGVVVAVAASGHGRFHAELFQQDGDRTLFACDAYCV